jgi:hypothetical protein
MLGPRAVLPVALVVVTAGCAAPTAPSGTADRTTSHSPPTTTERTPTVTPTPEPTTVEYVVRARQMPDAFASVTVTLQAVSVERAGDLGPCYPEIFSGPYKPTVTPLPTPRGRCERADGVAVDLVEIEDGRTVVIDTAPPWAEAHALVVTDVTATYENGSEAAVKNAGGFEVFASEKPPTGSYRVELRVGSGPGGVGYDYWIGGRAADER